jgi:hypothetical protein
VGFNKKEYEPNIPIVVNHPWHPSTDFKFFFAKRLSQSALDAETKYLGMKDEERPEAYREALIDLVIKMMSSPPEGFDDLVIPVGFSSEHGFPSETAQRQAAEQAMRVYFDDPAYPELETILVSAWKGYRVAALPTSFPQSVRSSEQADDSASGATSET